eukprot:gene28591-5886_t
MANVSRPDLPAAGVAPNPNHGISIELPAATVAALQHGVHHVRVRATGSMRGCGQYAFVLPANVNALSCVCDGKPCACPPSPPAPLPAPLVIRGTLINSSAAPAGEGSATPALTAACNTSTKSARPTISLGGYGTGITVKGFASVSIIGVAVVDASAAVWVTSASSTLHELGARAEAKAGTLLVEDCSIRGVWNRSSIGQALPTPGKRDCFSGWSDSIAFEGDFFANVTVQRCYFDDVDTAFQAHGNAGTVRFVRNTVTRANGNTVMMTGNTDWQIAGNVFSRNYAPRFFMCGTTDIMVGGYGTTGTIVGNEIGWRGEHPS